MERTWPELQGGFERKAFAVVEPFGVILESGGLTATPDVCVEPSRQLGSTVQIGMNPGFAIH
jgi:hypothetical protein